MKNKLTPIAQAWHDFKQLFHESVHRDIAMMNVGQQVWAALDNYNFNSGTMMTEDTSGNDYHWLQDLYVADDGSIYAISCSNGKLYRWPVTIATDNTVTIGQNQEVTPLFIGNPQEQTFSRVHRNAQTGRYEGFAVMGTCALNKDNAIDARCLFDCFVERFTGKREYINIYHLGGDVTRIGEITMIFRADNLLVGHYILDDNPVANAAGATLAADETGEWGGSIEFLSDDEGKPTEVATNVFATVYTKGTLQGFSVARAVHGAAWGTSHFITREPQKMDKKLEDSISQLLGNNAEALEQFKQWIDGKNLRLVDSITQTAADQQAAPVAQTSDLISDPNNEIVVDESLLSAITQAVQNSEWFKATAVAQIQFGDRLAAIEESVTQLQNRENQPATQPAPEPVVPVAPAEPVAQLSQALYDRLTSIEQVVEQFRSFYEKSKPAQGQQVATFRPGRSTTPQAPGAKPPAVVTQQVQPATIPLAAGQPVSMKSLWRRPNKTLDRLANHS